MTTTEINEVFRSLGLDTEEKRDAMLFQCLPPEGRGSIQIITTDSTSGPSINNGGIDFAYFERNSE
jgi:hypothetical protein